MPVLLSLFGLLGIPVGVYLLTLCARGGVSFWGWLWMAIFIAADVAALQAQSNPRRSKIAGAIAAGLLAILVGVRHTRVHPTAMGTTVMLPSGAPGPWIDRLAEDGDLGMMQFIAMGDFGAISAEDRRRARPYVRAAWLRMRRDPEYAAVPSPIPTNLLARTAPTNLHTLVLNPPAAGAKAARAIIFLHGAGGSSKLPCYLLARRMPDAMIVCPTVGMSGEWANEDGMTAWQTVLTYTRERAEAVYAIGNGYGGRGLLHLLHANLVGHLSGGVLLSGFDEHYYDDVRRAAMPMLILRGEEDARTIPYRVEGLANTDRTQNMEFPGGFFLLYEQEDAVLEAIDLFCGGH